MIRLGILLSGRGSNFMAIADNIARGSLDAEIVAVISNQPDAPAVAEAHRRGLHTVVLPSRGRKREEHDRAMAEALRQSGAELIVLAGYMRLLSPWFVRQFQGKILNIHPSLLPALDDEHTLSARILAQEHVAYSEAIALLADGRLSVEGRRVIFKLGNSREQRTL